MSRPITFAVGPEFLRRDGLAETILPWEDGQRVPTSRGAFEWWYFDAHFDDGTTAVIVFATKPIADPRRPLMPNLSLTVTRPDGTKTAQFDLPQAGEFSASKETCDVRVGRSWVKWSERGGGWTYVLHAETEALSADLTFTGLVPPWRPGAGKSYFGDPRRDGATCPYFAWLPAIPYGTVTGTLVYDGQAHTVQGIGYHDHNWGNVALASVLNHWVWGRAHLDGYTLIFVEQIAVRKYGSARLPVILLTKGNQVLVEDPRPMTMQARDFVRHPGGREYPREVDFVWKRGREGVRVALREPSLIEAVSLLGGLPRWKRSLARLVANPYYFRFNAELDLALELDGLRDRLSGTALYELMMLR
jgi:predicted secreted hydrolase